MSRVFTQVSAKGAIRQVLQEPARLNKYSIERFKLSANGDLSLHHIAQKDRVQHLFGGMYSPYMPPHTIYTTPPSFGPFGLLNSVARNHPLKFSLVITAFKATLADFVAQKYIEKKEKFDFRRNALFFAFGAAYSGGICHTLYNQVYTRLFASRTFANTVKMVLFDNLINTPLIFFPTLYLLKECILEKTYDAKVAFTKYKENILEAASESWKMWVPAHFITFGLLPVYLRVPFTTFVSFFFYTSVSYQQTKFEEKRMLELEAQEEG